MSHGRQNKDSGVQDSAAAVPSRYVLVALIVVSMVGVLLILRPHLHSIILGLLLASVFAPLHRRILARMPKYENVAAFFCVLLVSLLVIVPSSVLGAVLVNQAVATFQTMHTWVTDGNLQKAMESPRVQAWLQRPLVARARSTIETHLKVQNEGGAELAKPLFDLTRTVLEFTGRKLLPVLSATGALLMGFVIMLFVMFYAFRDGQAMIQYVLHLSPLPESQEQMVIERIRHVARAVLLGTFLTSSAQAVAAMIGFAIVGIPAVFWGVMVGVASLIPVVGTALVWVPAALYLFLTGHTGSAVLLAVWCALLVGMLDNVLKPILVGRRFGMSSALIFFAIIGGIQLFGPVGILYVPLIFGVCAVCLYMYEVENTAYLKHQDRQ